jgi:hypothetical protein
MLIQGDCLEAMKTVETNSIDLLFCDLPYGQTSCKWDCLIDLDLFWKQVNRICKERTPMFFTCSTKFGVSLINSNPKNFRYDLVWIKSAPCGFLNAKKMPMKKHEMVYVFYKKLPLYDLSSHSHKFIKEVDKHNRRGETYDTTRKEKGLCIQGKYDPPLPTSVVRETSNYKNESDMYGKIIRTDCMRKNNESMYDPPLPTSVIKDTFIRGKTKTTTNEDVYNSDERVINGKLYHHARHLQKGNDSIYDPPLPTSVVKEKTPGNGEVYDEYLINKPKYPKLGANGTDCHVYDPPLPNSILEVASEKGKHPTQKPVGLIEWCLKYYSKEGDTVLDPTMGSGSTGVACMNMNRQFIGIEQDEEIFKVAQSRIEL